MKKCWVGLASVVVVMPARDESALVRRAVVAVQASAAYAHGSGIETTIIVVADSCRDDTAAVARAQNVIVMETELGSVGAARAAGVREGLDLSAELSKTIVMSTDSDSVVPQTWITDHVGLHRQGAEIVMGLVSLEEGTASAGIIGAWNMAYVHASGVHRSEGGHGHIHGANLSIRADSYLELGGFEPLFEHEDVRLARRAMTAGMQFAWTELSPVATSARSIGRTPGGVASDIRELTLDN